MSTEVSREEEKARHEREIFIAFANVAQLDLDLNSVRSERPPKPDICCMIGGELHYFELAEITDEGLARRLDTSLKEMRITGGFFSQKRPLIKAFTSKASKQYSADDGVLELLAYYDKQHPDTAAPTLIPKEIGSIADDMISSGGWSRVWVYNDWKKELLWMYPTD